MAAKVKEVEKAEAQAKTTVHAGVKIVDAQETPLDAATVKLLIEGLNSSLDFQSKLCNTIQYGKISEHR